MSTPNTSFSRLVHQLINEDDVNEYEFLIAVVELWIRLSNEPMEQLIDGDMTSDKNKILSKLDGGFKFEKLSVGAQSSIVKRVILKSARDAGSVSHPLSLIRAAHSCSIDREIIEFVFGGYRLNDPFIYGLWADCVHKVLQVPEYLPTMLHKTVTESRAREFLQIDTLKPPPHVLKDIQRIQIEFQRKGV